MSFRSDIVKRLQKREEMILDVRLHLDELHSELASHLAVADELRAILKNLPVDDEAEQQSTEPALRPGSDVAKAREHLHNLGKPTHVDDLLKLLGKTVEKKTRASLSGQLSLYARKNQIFTRPAPNTFGLREWLVNAAAPKPEILSAGDNGEALPLPVEELSALQLPPDDEDVQEPAH